MKLAFFRILLPAALLLAGCDSLRQQSDQGILDTPSPTIQPSSTPSITPSPLPPTLTPFQPDLKPTLTATPIPFVCRKTSGVMVLASLEDDRLSKPMDYRVFLPPCYNDDLERHYPVLYLIHGQSYNPDQWDRLGADDTAAELFSAGELPPFLIVMPGDRIWSEPEDDPFGKVFMEELIPLIDASYRTLPEPRYRAIGGLSRGAAWAVHLGLGYPEVFGVVGAHSLAVFWADTYGLRKKLAEIPPNEMPRIYIDDGEKDRWIESAIWFEKLLTELDIAHEWHLFDGYHEEKYWREHVEGYLRFYADDWPR